MQFGVNANSQGVGGDEAGSVIVMQLVFFILFFFFSFFLVYSRLQYFLENMFHYSD